LSWDYILKPTIVFLSANVAGEAFLCLFTFCFFYACTVIIADCIKATINAIQWLIDDMGGVFNAFLLIIIMIICGPFFWVYHTVSDLFLFTEEFFFIERDHLKIISVYTTVLKIITCPLWNITGFLIKKMMNAFASAADGSGSGSIPGLTPVSPLSSPERPCRRRRYVNLPLDDLFNSKEFQTRQQQKQSKDDRRNAYNEEEVDVEHIDLDKFVSNHLEKKSKGRNFRQQQQPPQPEVAAPAPTAPAPIAAPAQEPAPAAARIMKRRNFVNPITGPTVKLSTKRSQRWWMTNDENDDGYNELDRSRSGSRMKMCTDEEYFKEIALVAFPADEFLKTSSRPFNKETPPASSVPWHKQQQQQQDDPDVVIVTSQFAAMRNISCKKNDETIIVETVEDGDYKYMRPQEDETRSIDLFDNFQDKGAIWDYIETAWEDDNL
jgi:hypothetical protein